MIPGLQQATHTRKQREIGTDTQRCFGRGASDREPAFLSQHKQPTPRPGTAERAPAAACMKVSCEFPLSFTLTEPLIRAHAFMHTTPSHKELLILSCPLLHAFILTQTFNTYDLPHYPVTVHYGIHSLPQPVVYRWECLTGTQLDTSFYITLSDTISGI